MTPDIRALIKEVLAEELAALRAERYRSLAVREERVAISSSAALNDFVLDVLCRAEDADFAAALREGRLRFTLAGSPDGGACSTALPESPTPSLLATTAPASLPEFSKPLIVERDIAALPEGASRLKIGRNSRLTPLAKDEARRRGIEIERKTA